MQHELLHLQQPDPGWHSKLGSTTDVVFVTGPHWASVSRFYQNGGRTVPRVQYSAAVGVAARTIANTMRNFRGNKLFASYPPVHFKGGPWHKGGRCDMYTQPLTSSQYSPLAEAEQHNRMLMENLAGTDVRLFNITKVSGLRPDGHPSSLQSFMGAGGNRIQDCVHWCLPGVPDVWSQLLSYELGCHLQGDFRNRPSS